ncbi:hypothetical protein AWM68_05830 [Fictibacillus phosphorivorans]|uniref:Uncharacterized protein n=1 Tax=Fictibacillus phosphorivorans TaxID=1221500 RepID=A0A163QXL3_9BACL|nr:hypothetical protein [Fictibacillus phosphorivorans]KZE65898.1 hypothetical protein AWM68_05830 [Fictibacillus phosphorivorans]
MYGLIFFSLLLNIICVYFLFKVWKKVHVQPVNQDSYINEDVGELLELFSQEMKEENARLHEMIIQFSKQIKENHDSNSMQEVAEEVDTNLVEEVKNLHADENNARNKVLLLARQGYNAEEIAKMLDRGKGEVQLLLKFYA